MTPQAEAEAVGREAALGNTTNQITPSDPRRERYRLQASAQSLLPDERVAGCMHTRVQEFVGIWASSDSRCYYSGVQVCGSVWHCPVCAAKVGERRKLEVEQAVESWLAEGGAVALVAITFPHSRDDDLASNLARFQDGLTRLRRGNPWKRIKQRHGWFGDIQALEVTWGQENGWHPHKHLVVLCASDTDEAELRGDLLSRWQRMAERAGLPEPSADYGVDVQVRRAGDIDPGQASRYLTKSTASGSGWSEGCELTKATVKRAKGGRFTPWDLLRSYAETGDPAMGSRFREYADRFKGRPQLVWSNGLKDHFGINDEPDAEVAEEIEEPEEVAALGPEVWRFVQAERAQAEVLEVAESHGFEGVDRWCRDRGFGGAMAPGAATLPHSHGPPLGLDREQLDGPVSPDEPRRRDRVAPGPWEV